MVDDMQKATVFVLAKCKADNLRPWNNEEKFISKRSMGSLIKINDRIYVLTCYHGVRNNVNVVMHRLISSGKIQKMGINLVAMAPELDIALFKTELDDDDFITFEDFNYKFPEEGTRLNIFLNELKQTSETNAVLNSHSFTCNCKDIFFEKQNAFNMPVMPIINIDISSPTDSHKLSGVSGSLVIDPKIDAKICGMVSYSDSGLSDISLVPSATILRFLTEFKNSNTYFGLCGLFSEIEVDENKKFVVKQSIQHKNKKNLEYIPKKSKNSPGDYYLNRT